jgi:hypothetical protein
MDCACRWKSPLVVCLFTLLAIGCGSDGGSDGDGGGGGTGDCTDHRYYCITTTIEPDSPLVEPTVTTEVIDLCGGDPEDVIDPQCTGTVNGSSVSFDCEYGDTVGSCTTNWTIQADGTVTEQEIDIAGTGSLDVSGNCGLLMDMDFDYSIVGFRVDSATDPCGPAAPFEMTVQKPSGTVVLETTSISVIRDPGTGTYTIAPSLGDVSGGSISYTLTLVIPPVGSTPETLDVECAGMLPPGVAMFSWLELDMGNPSDQWTLCPGGSGTVTITGMTESTIAGSFEISGTTSGSGGAESRTLSGSFDLSAGGVSGPTALEELRRSLVGMIGRSNDAGHPLAP